MEVFDKRAVYAGLIDRYREVCDRYNEGRPMRTICFNVNVAHSLAVTHEFNQAGFVARHLDGNTNPAERASVLAGFKSGAFDIICNVGILNAGFDDPQTSCIIMNRATKSVPLWLQSCGRGSRISPGKGKFVILDMGDNWTELGLWSAQRDWESLWTGRKKKSDKEGVAPVKECPGCGALIPPAVTTCPECDLLLPKKERKIAQVSEFAEVTAADAASVFTRDQITDMMKVDRASMWSTLPVAMLENIRIWKGRKPGWPIHVIREGSQTEEEFRDKLYELAALRGYRESWVAHQTFKPVLSYA